MGRRPKCPHCGASGVARIIYGTAQPTGRFRRELTEGRAVLGGPGSGDKAPRWFCPWCGKDFGGRSLGPEEALGFLLGRDRELLTVTSRLRSAGFHGEADAITRARRALYDRIEQLSRKTDAHELIETLAPRAGRRGEKWTEEETLLAYALLKRRAAFPTNREMENLAESLGRSVGSVGRKLANLMASETGGASGLAHRSKIDDQVVREYAGHVRRLQREARRIRRALGRRPAGEVTSLRSLQFEFWWEFNALAEREGTTLRLSSAGHRHWYSFPVGRTGFWISLSIDVRRSELRCALVIQGAHATRALEQLGAEKDAIEAELGPVEWKETPGRTRTRIVQRRHGDLRERKSWPELVAWCKERAEAFHRAFAPRVRTLVLVLKAARLA